MNTVLLLLTGMIVLILILILIITQPKEHFIYTDEYLTHHSGTIDKHYHTIRRTNRLSRVLVFQTAAYQEIPDYIQYSKYINKAYCAKWGYDYKYYTHDVKEMPPYWLKVKDIEYSLDKFPMYDYIMFMDLDAVFNDFSVSIDDVLEHIGHYDIYMGKNPAPDKLINAGVIIVRNCGYTKDIIGKWMAMCVNDRCKHWNFENGKWECPNCVYAGRYYEQESLEELYETMDKNKAVILNTQFLSNNQSWDHSFILHLMNRDNEERASILKNKLYSSEH